MVSSIERIILASSGEIESFFSRCWISSTACSLLKFAVQDVNTIDSIIKNRYIFRCNNQ